MKSNRTYQLYNRQQGTKKVYLNKSKILIKLFIYLIVTSFPLAEIIFMIFFLFFIIVVIYKNIKHLRLWKKKIPIIILDKEHIQIFKRGKYDIYQWEDFIRLKDLHWVKNPYDYEIFLKKKKENDIVDPNHLDKFYRFMEEPFINSFTSKKIKIYGFVHLDHTYGELSRICEDYMFQNNLKMKK